MIEDDNSFLGRWSRRKRGADDPVPPTTPQAAPEPDVAEPEPVLSQEELAALPRIEDLTESSDIRGFLRPGVPTVLKNAALRRIWMLTPAIRDYRDPAVDYAWDWNTPGGVPGDGCAPSPERAAQMLRDLFSPKTPESSDAAVAQSAPDSEAETPPDPGEPQAIEQRSTEVSGDFSQKLPETPVSTPRPRHGGALPS